MIWNFAGAKYPAMSIGVAEDVTTVFRYGFALAVLVFLSRTVVSASEFAVLEEPLAGIPVAVNSSDTNLNYKSSYSRFNEVKKQCKGLLTDASVLPGDTQKLNKFGNHSHSFFRFVNGDWRQSPGSAPFMPFVADHQEDNNYAAVNLASFTITHIQRPQAPNKVLNVSGVLKLAISSTISISFMQKNPDGFSIYPGFSSVDIFLEGIYLESKRSGERFVCMLGNGLLPFRGENDAQPWDWLNDSSQTKPSLAEDDQIRLQLTYPAKFSLTSREIKGNLISLSSHTSSKYFDAIKISAQLERSISYQFHSTDLVKKACNQHPHADKDQPQPQEIERYRGDMFCSLFEEINRNYVLDVVPNWNCQGPADYCNKLGPFVFGKEAVSGNGSFSNMKLAIQNVICAPQAKDNSPGGMSDVSAVFRLVLPKQYLFLALERSGLDNLTLSVEGSWNASSGHLCMVGCLGSSQTSESSCDIKVSIYITLSFSIKQRNIMLGNISSINDALHPFYPLSFELPISFDNGPLRWEQSNRMVYKYSKIKDAGIFLEKYEPVGYGDRFKKTFLKYPLSDLVKEAKSFYFLREDLSLTTAASLENITNGHLPKPLIKSVNIDVIAIGDVVGTDWVEESTTFVVPENISNPSSKPKVQDMKYFIKVAAQLKLFGNFSRLSVEGLYDPRVGKMYLIGCRDVRVPWVILHDSYDLESGLDCEIEVKIEYPPTNMRWFTDPSAKIFINSKRTVDDSLFFQQIKIQTYPIMYRRQREDIISQESVEGMLSILTLSVVVACILSQFFYIQESKEVAPYMSLVMLGIQAIGFSIPLITDADVLFKQKNGSENDIYSAYHASQWSKIIDYVAKLLLLVAFLLILTLFQKVWKSRIKLLTRSPLEKWRVPSDRKVLVIFSLVHVVGFIIVLIIHPFKNRNSGPPSYEYGYHYENSRNMVVMKEYIGLMQDLFLLPQIFGNHLWQVDCKPLRKIYYLGVTTTRILPHAYDYMRSPVLDPYFLNYDRFANPSLDFYSKIGDIVISILAILLALVVFIQQQWKDLKAGKLQRFTSISNSWFGSQKYEKLPSQSFEAELASSTHPRRNVQVDGPD